VMAKTTVDLLRDRIKQPQHAADAAIRLLASRAKGTGGLILLNREGQSAVSFNTPQMAYGYVLPDGNFFTAA
jgi:isoaspartyl peptidase/L-asparaginase-like protein (Ntn-hydrolase superfamily)